ncbi:hypothetical protein [Sphingobacterium detergens]
MGHRPESFFDLPHSFRHPDQVRDNNKSTSKMKIEMESKFFSWSLNSDLTIGIHDGLKMAFETEANRAKSKRIEENYPELLPVSFIEVYVQYKAVARVDVGHLNEQQIEYEKQRLSLKFNHQCAIAHYCHYQEQGLKLDFFEEAI